MKIYKYLSFSMKFCLLALIWFVTGCALINGPSKTEDSLPKDSECFKNGVQIFNKNATGNVIRDILKAKDRGSDLSELRKLYPQARDEWNSALREIKNSYSRGWTGLTESDYNKTEKSDVINRNIEKIYDTGSNKRTNQTFFELLIEIAYGRRSDKPMDTYFAAAIAEQSKIKNRLNAAVKSTLDRECRFQDYKLVQKAIDPLYLPQDFDDCLTMKID